MYNFIDLSLSRVDLFERAWGWDTILPWNTVQPMSQYKRYLEDYYNHNQRETNAASDLGLDGDDHVKNGLAALAHSVPSFLPPYYPVQFSICS